MTILKLGLTLIAIVSVVMGIIFTAAPRRTIEAQIAFYRLINWKMEPVSWEKEIRNTRIMGIIALVCGMILFRLSGS